MKSIRDTFTLNNGVRIPVLGLGTGQITDRSELLASVRVALQNGYRHIDTAWVYDNEALVGEAVRSSGVDRDRLFVTSKLAIYDRGYDATLRAFDRTMRTLGLDYLDLYLIHWPDHAQPVNNLQGWRAIEKFYREKRVRAIGVSNFMPHHLRPLLEECEVAPMVNQIEFHPGHMQRECVEFCREHDILIEAWSPLGSGRLLADPELGKLAAGYGKSTAQLCLRWCLQHGTLPLAKSVTPERIKTNADIFDFIISGTDMRAIDALPDRWWSGSDPDKMSLEWPTAPPCGR